ncbi:MAG: TIGR02646 family protein [Candidatus Sumerlaeota bacterium]|nr:TIGR02646 family protein [Candidatus Sumerlaeota bacterium]
MKHIQKVIDSKTLLEFKAKWKDAECGPVWSNLDKEEKHQLKQELMIEQGKICCYCERRLIEAESDIEHFHPRHGVHGDLNLALQYSNLFCSCRRSKPDDESPNTLAKRDWIHCNQRKDKRFDSLLLISPLDDDCEQYFTYTDKGKIEFARHLSPSNKEKAAYTLEVLGLDARILDLEREMVLDPFINSMGSLDEIQMRRWMQGIAERNSQEEFQEFFTLVMDYFRRYYPAFFEK